jgi:hypothetical protein
MTTMKIVNVVSAKSIWLFDINDLNPRGKDIHPELLEWLKDNYHFDKAPASIEQVDPKTQALKFERGRFQIKEEIYISVDLEVYNDGIVANSRSSTRDTDTFIEDVLSSASKEFSLVYDPGMIRDRMHTSELTVRLDRLLSSLNPKLAEFADKITTACGHNNIPNFELNSIGFGNDIVMSRLKLAGFLLERQAKAPYSERRFFSRAPVHTDQHEQLLLELEGILAGK